jgi:hypothetical protein
VIYSMTVPLDGFIARPDGDIGWTAPDAELLHFHIEQTGEIAAHLCGRGLYQEMLVWETAEHTMPGEAELEWRDGYERLAISAQTRTAASTSTQDSELCLVGGASP